MRRATRIARLVDEIDTLAPEYYEIVEKRRKGAVTAQEVYEVESMLLGTILEWVRETKGWT
jgi:hypothetical protein